MGNCESIVFAHGLHTHSFAGDGAATMNIVRFCVRARAQTRLFAIWNVDARLCQTSSSSAVRGRHLRLMEIMFCRFPLHRWKTAAADPLLGFRYIVCIHMCI